MSSTASLRTAEQRLRALESGAARRALERLHGLEGAAVPGLAEALERLYRDVLRHYAARFGAQAPCLLVRAPARVNLMGMHIDHRGGAINPIALLETLACAGPRDDGVVRVENVDPQYPPREFNIAAELPRARVLDWEGWTRERYAARARAGAAGDWSDYVKAAVLYYQNRHKGPTGQTQRAVPGLNLVFGSLVPPAAGLSSSSSVVVASLVAALSFAGEWGAIETEELIDWCGDAEWYVGTRGGKGDHASILCGRPGGMLHLEFFPTRVRSYALPPETRIVLAHSCVEAKKSAGARDFFNQRIAAYVIGEHLLKRLEPARFEAAPNLAACTPRRGGYPEVELYRALKRVPERMTRTEALEALPTAREPLEKIFASHQEPPEGYEVRQILLYGLAEVERSDRGPEALERGDAAAFGKLMNLSHEGDRIVRHVIGPGGRVEGQAATAHRYPDGLLDQLAAAGTPLWTVPGGYDACVLETDLLADLALAVPGVFGARLIGAGRGGCVGMLCRSAATEALLAQLRQGYYLPRGLPPERAFVAAPCQGAGVFEPE